MRYLSGLLARLSRRRCGFGHDQPAFTSGSDLAQPSYTREFLGKLINAAPDPIFVKDRQHRFILLNDAMCDFMGLRREALIGKSDYDIVPRAEADIFREKDEIVFTTGVENINEESVTGAHGVTHIVITKKAVFPDDQGRLVLVGVIRDVTEQKRTEKLLREREQLVRDVIDNVPAMVSLWGSDLRNRLVNRQARFFQIPAEEFSGRHLNDIIGEAAVAAHRPYHDAVLRGEEPRFEMTQTTPSGETRSRQITFIPDRQGGKIVGFYSFGVDVTELKQTERQLIAARDAAESANAAKSAFLAQMSHELRTPLNAVIGFTEMLQLDLEHNLSDRQRTYLGHIAESAQHQLKLVQDLLEFAGMDIGQLRFDIRRVDVQAAVQSAWRQVQPFADKAGVDFKCSAPNLPDVQADPLRLHQILINLATNAVKYNRRGGWVRIAAEERPGKRVRFTVADNGKGIPPEARSRLFVPFEKLGGERSAIEGMGLGLALVKGLAEHMGGTVGYEQPADGGSLFWVELPLAG